MPQDLLEPPKIPISLFTPFKNKDGIYVPGVIAKNADLYTELEKFRDGYYSSIVEGLQKIEDPEEKSRYKMENLPAFTLSARFKEKDYRNTANMLSTTEMLCVDVDYGGVSEFMLKKREENPQYSLADLRDEIYGTMPCVFAALSCSGRGIFFLVRYEKDQHLDCFLDIEMYMKSKFGVKIDASCKDFVRLRFATFDPGARIQQWEHTRVWALRPEYLKHKKKLEEFRKQEQKRVIVRHTNDKEGAIMEKAIALIHNAQKGERHNKIRAAARLTGGYIATGVLDEDYARDKIMEAALASGYDDSRDAEKAIKFGIETGKLNPLEINIITPDDPEFDFFVEQEEQRQREIRALYIELYKSNASGIPLTELNWDDLATRYLVDIERIKKIAARTYDKFLYMHGINNRPALAQVEAYLTSRYEMRRDIISDSIQLRQHGMREWVTVQAENIWRDTTNKGYKLKFHELSHLLNSDYIERANVWLDHFKALRKKEENVDYIAQLSSHITMKDKSEQEFFETMFKKMLVRSVKCALDDYYANRTVFVLASKMQSNGKSSFIRWLNPFGAHLFYAENPLEDNKDARIRLAETFIYNLEELSTSTKTEINRLKAIISQIGSRDRKPYGRQAENIVRRCNFWASTNNLTFLTDETNTRWLCFEVGRINWSYTKLDRDSIWAQAYELYKSGYDCELTQEEATMREVKNEKFTIVTAETDLMLRYFEPSHETVPDAIFLTSTSIQEDLLILTKESRIAINAIWVGRALARLKFVRERFDRKWGYWVRPINRTAYSHSVTPDNDMVMPSDPEIMPASTHYSHSNEISSEAVETAEDGLTYDTPDENDEIPF